MFDYFQQREHFLDWNITTKIVFDLILKIKAPIFSLTLTFESKVGIKNEFCDLVKSSFKVNIELFFKIRNLNVNLWKWTWFMNCDSSIQKVSVLM